MQSRLSYYLDIVKAQVNITKTIINHKYGSVILKITSQFGFLSENTRGGNSCFAEVASRPTCLLDI